MRRAAWRLPAHRAETPLFEKPAEKWDSWPPMNADERG
jgi:hypothetical protein